jgi:sugar/nucleoside kinase (ribokinase family)
MDEVALELARHFPDALVGVTPQGWMRGIQAEGFVERRDWAPPSHLASCVEAAVFGEEDVESDASAIAELVSLFHITVVTKGAGGARLYIDGENVENLSAPVKEEVDPTGAGDIFAAAFFIGLASGQSPLSSARAATTLAAESVTGPGLAGVPTPEEARYLLLPR